MEGILAGHGGDEVVKVHWFYVFDLEAEGRKKPIGAWILQDGKLDYVFNPAYPEDEAIPSDLINRMLEVGAKVLGLEGLEYWQGHVGYHRSAGEIVEEDVHDYAGFLARMNNAIEAT